MLRIRLLALVLAGSAVVVACGGSNAATAPPATPVPAPTPTPNPHLSDPASVDKVYQALRKSGLQIVGNSADAGNGNEPLKRLNLTYDSWPLILREYSNATALKDSTKFDPKRKPVYGDPPYTFVGLNIYVEYGPQIGQGKVVRPDRRFIDAALKLVAVLDPLIGPLRQSSVDPVDLPGAPPAPSVSPEPSTTPATSP